MGDMNGQKLNWMEVRYLKVNHASHGDYCFKCDLIAPCIVYKAAVTLEELGYQEKVEPPLIF